MENKKIIKNSIITWLVVLGLGGLVLFAVDMDTGIGVKIFIYLIVVGFGGLFYGIITAGITILCKFLKSKIPKKNSKQRYAGCKSDLNF